MPARDAFKLLGALAAQPNMLAELAPDAMRAALFLIRKALKSPDLTLERLSALHDTLGGAAMCEAVSGLSRTAAGEIVKRLDRRNPNARGPAYGIDENWSRARILALATKAAHPFVDASPAAAEEPAAAPDPETIALALREARGPVGGGERTDGARASARLKSA